MNKKILLTLLLGIFLFSSISAASIGTPKINEPMKITNYCQIGSCTYMNLTSLTLPNGTLINMNTAMTKNIQDFSYDYTPTLLGTYYFTTCGDPDGIVCDKDNFKVTPNGDLLDNGKSIIYLGLLIIILALFVMTINGMITVDDFGWSFGFLNIAYILFNSFLYTGWKIASNYIYSIPTIGAFLHGFWVITNIAWIPFILAQVAWIALKMTDQKNIEGLVKKGYSESDARKKISKR